MSESRKFVLLYVGFYKYEKIKVARFISYNEKVLVKIRDMLKCSNLGTFFQRRIVFYYFFIPGFFLCFI